MSFRGYRTIGTSLESFTTHFMFISRLINCHTLITTGRRSPAVYTYTYSIFYVDVGLRVGLSSSNPNFAFTFLRCYLTTKAHIWPTLSQELAQQSHPGGTNLYYTA